MLAWLHRDLGALGLLEAVRRCTLVPARILEPCVPAFARKGRLRAGADADVLVIDLDRLTPSTDFSRVHTTTGIEPVFVGGHPVVTEGVLDLTARPGRAVTAR